MRLYQLQTSYSVEWPITRKLWTIKLEEYRRQRLWPILRYLFSHVSETNATLRKFLAMWLWIELLCVQFDNMARGRLLLRRLSSPCGPARYVCGPFKLLNQLIDFQDIRYECYATGGNSNLILSNFVQPVLTTRHSMNLWVAMTLTTMMSGEKSST